MIEVVKFNDSIFYEFFFEIWKKLEIKLFMSLLKTQNKFLI